MNFKNLLEKFDNINGKALTEAKAEMKPFKQEEKKEEKKDSKKDDKKTNESMWNLMQVYHVLEQKTVVTEEKARYSVKLEHPDGKTKNVNVEASSESDAKKKATNDPKWRAVSARKLGDAAEIKEGKKEVDEEKTDEGNAVTGGLADPDVEVGEKIPGTDVVKKKHITTEAEDKEDKKDDEDKEDVNESADSEHHVYSRHKDDKGKIKYKLIKSFTGQDRGEEAQDHADKWNDKQKDAHTRAVVKTKKIKEAIDHTDLEECYDGAMSGSQQESGMNINASTDTRTGSKSLTVTATGDSAEQLARLLKLSGLGGQAAPQGDMEVNVESEYANEPAVEVQGLESQLSQGNDLNRPKTMHQHSYRQGDNPMAMREARELAELEKQLTEALAEFKVSKDVAEAGVRQLPTQGADYSKHSTAELKMMLRPGILHRDEARFKALIRKELQKREQQGQQGVAEAKKGSKPDFLDMDKDGDRKEPMKKAIDDKKQPPKKK